ncbi:jg24380 [Pararge aegeria aegeria]|uniref:Jg24380 protein n=1 Tax=Pararge aegeria aegeria TaxID=348720 RepID=A0A8S4QLE8_9NEOP|nr:jg24380 [Pararge aegeria aegeria]
MHRRGFFTVQVRRKTAFSGATVSLKPALNLTICCNAACGAAGPQTVLSEVHKCRAQGPPDGPPRPAPALGPRALLSALAQLHTRAVT